MKSLLLKRTVRSFNLCMSIGILTVKCSILFLFICFTSFAQERLLEKKIKLNLSNESVSGALSHISKKAGCTFSYSSSSLSPSKRINFNDTEITILEALQQIFGKSLEKLETRGNKILIVLKEAHSSVLGSVKTDDGRPVAFANVNIIGYGSTQTDESGKYSLENIPSGRHRILISLIGLEPTGTEILLGSDKPLVQDFILNSSATGLDEVVVTASRLAESINEVPSTITYIKPSDVEMQSQINSNLPNILMQKVPGISPSEESQNNYIAKIRGRSFLVLIDGIPQTTPLRNGGRDLRSIDASAIDHIEVINGASAMYGNGAAGGIINYITKKPREDRPFSSSTYINNTLSLIKPSETHGYNFSQLFSGKTDKLDYVLQGKIARTGVVRSSDGKVVSPFYGLGETDSYNALLKMGYDFNRNHRVEITGNYYRSIQDSKYVGTTGEYGVSPAIGIPSDTAINGGIPFNKTLSMRYDGTYGKTQANISLYYDDMHTVFETYNQIYSDHKGARLNFNTPFEIGRGNELTLIYGLDLLKDHTVQKTMTEQLITPDMNMSSIAPYLQSKFNLFEHWVIKTGVRFENLRFKVSDLTNNDQTTPGDNNKSNALVFNAGVRFNKLVCLQPFVSFSQGYSIGDVGLILRNGVPLSSIDPEPVLVNNFEAGFNGKAGIAKYQFTGYYSTSKKGNTFIETGMPGNYELTQIPQRIYGVEGVVDLSPTRWLTLGGIIGYMNGRQDANNTGDFKDKLDNSIISPLKINMNASVKLTKNWNFLLQMTHIEGRDVFPVEEYNYAKYPISGYTLFDLHTGYKIKNVSLNLSVSNLFNTNYFPLHSEVRGATNEGRYYINGSGSLATLGLVVDL